MSTHSHADDDELRRSRELIELLKVKHTEIAAEMRRAEAAGITGRLSEQSEKLMAESDELSRALDAEADRIQKQWGIPNELLEAIENSKMPSLEQRYLRHEVHQSPTTSDLNEETRAALEVLRQYASSSWLKEQAQHSFRLRYDDSPNSFRRLHLVGRERLLPDGLSRPHRFAEMILLAQDLVAERADLDFFAASLLLPEFATLGQSLSHIELLGNEAVRKLTQLPSMQTQQVAATVYELLVGAACVRKGNELEMLPVSNASKMPEYRVKSSTVPLVIECKRRELFQTYVQVEARAVERLFAAAEGTFEKYHLSVEAEFADEPGSIDISEFAGAIERLSDSWDEALSETFAWGSLRVQRLPIEAEFPLTRVYSPNFLSAVFDWNYQNDDWDGLLCEIDALAHCVADRVSAPRCLKWKCSHRRSLLKKSRDITYLWGEALSQIPTGEMGFIYVAYTEAMRPSIADSRTRHLMEAVQHDWFHRWGIVVPLSIVNRFYPQPRGDGIPDFIESSMPVCADGAEFLLEKYPINVIAWPPNES